MDVSFSINQHDSDGDVYDQCVLLHCGDSTILRFENVEKLEQFCNAAKRCCDEINRDW
jgi:hypothetical protein